MSEKCQLPRVNYHFELLKLKLILHKSSCRSFIWILSVYVNFFTIKHKFSFLCYYDQFQLLKHQSNFYVLAFASNSLQIRSLPIGICISSEISVLGLFRLFDREIVWSKFCTPFFVYTTVAWQGSHLNENFWILQKIVANCDYFRYFFSN